MGSLVRHYHKDQSLEIYNAQLIANNIQIGLLDELLQHHIQDWNTFWHCKDQVAIALCQLTQTDYHDLQNHDKYFYLLKMFLTLKQDYSLLKNGNYVDLAIKKYLPDLTTMVNQLSQFNLIPNVHLLDHHLMAYRKSKEGQQLSPMEQAFLDVLINQLHINKLEMR